MNRRLRRNQTRFSMLCRLSLRSRTPGVKFPPKPAAMSEMPATVPFSATDRALERLREVAAAEGIDTQSTYLRVAVVTGGCSGLTYDLGWDTVRQPDDELVNVGDLQLVMDLKSQLYVEGTTLDFTEGLEGKGFHFDNPQAVRTCACGESFSL